MNISQYLQLAIDWLNSPVGKTIAVYVAGWGLKMWKPFFDKAIPVATLTINLLISVLGVITGAASGVHNTSFAVAAVTEAQQMNPLFDIILPQIIADGAYNWPRKIWKWLTDHSRKVFN